MYTSLGQAPRRQVLVTVIGPEIALENERAAERAITNARDFCRTQGHELAVLRSNFKQALDGERLGSVSSEIPVWWENVHHGPGLLGLLAPLSVQVGLDRVFIAATHTSGSATETHAWGSHPDLDSRVRWAGLSVVHHGHDATRQRKIARIAEHVAAGSAAPQLQVCWKDPQHGYGNCGHCEKCLRTAVGLLLAGADPRRFGIDVTAADALRRLRARMRGGRLEVTTPGKAAYWREMQAAARAAPPEDERLPLVEWLLAQDFERYYRRSGRLRQVRNGAARLTSRTPRLRAALRRLGRTGEAVVSRRSRAGYGTASRRAP